MLPLWSSNVKDHIVGGLIDKSLAPEIKIAAVFGAIMLAISSTLFAAARYRRKAQR